MKTGIKPKFLALIIPAVVLRLVFASLFFHPDIKSQHFHAQFMGQGITDIYSYIEINKHKLPYTDTFNYPPLAYYLLGSWNKISGLILGPNFYSWLNDWGPGGYFNSRMFEFMLVLKFPYILLDLGLGFLLVKFVNKPKLSEPLLAFWFFNPVSLYAVYMLGQFDILCAFLAMLALLLIKQKKLVLAAVCLGLGAAIKSYPLLLFPFLLIRVSNVKQAAVTIFAFLAAFTIPMLPVINSSAYRYTMTHSNLMQSIFVSGLDVSASQKVPYFVIVYTLTLFYALFRRHSFELLPEFVAVTLSVILLSDFHAQWIIWSLPFLAVLWTDALSGFRFLFILAGVGFLGVVFLVPDQYVLLGLFSQINSLAIIFPSIFEMLKSFTDPLLLQGLFRAVLVGSGLIIILESWKNYAEK